MCQEHEVNCCVVGVPKSIDNDILLIDKWVHLCLALAVMSLLLQEAAAGTWKALIPTGRKHTCTHSYAHTHACTHTHMLCHLNLLLHVPPSSSIAQLAPALPVLAFILGVTDGHFE